MTIAPPVGRAPDDHQANLDIEALRARYALERQRRINPRQNAQYVEVAGEFSRYIDDPYVDAPLVREALDRETEVVVVGGGFGGLLAAATLKKAGVDDLLMIEKAGDFGGTWYWNRYPGAQCDIESYIYMPLLEETGYMPTEKYAHAPELLAHAQRIGRHFGLYDQALLQTQILEMAWQEDARRWIVTTDRGDRIAARYVISASGPLNRPKLPGIPGIENFRGHSFHTSRWDYAYTGGDSGGNMTGLAEKRVAVIGTGATAVQCVPYLARDAGHLFVVQRTPSTVDVRGNKPTDTDWFANLEPGWQRERMDNFDILVSGMPADRDLVQDGWTDLFRELVLSWAPKDGTPLAPEEIVRLAEIADFRKGENVRARVDASVNDRATADGLKAWYGMRCKRPTFNDDFLPAFNRDNVTLIDTEGAGLDGFTENGILSGGVEYPVDCVVFATGFEVGTDYSRRAGFTVRGVDGRSLAEHFANGPRSFHGFHVNGFPNLFMLGMGQTGFKPNVTDMLAEHSEHIAGIFSAMAALGLSRVEATEAAEAAWLDLLFEKSQPIREFVAACTPGYYGGEGDIDRGLLVNTYGGGSIEFTALLRDWRSAGDMPGLRID